jgi:gentisate 1,2-dioxygenase
MSADTTSTAADAYEAIRTLGASPLRPYCGEIFPSEAKSRAVPFDPEVTKPPATVNALCAGIRITLSGEKAQGHRHTSNAFRLIVEGEGVCTTVNGARVHMRPGDLLLTPAGRGTTTITRAAAR